MNKLIFGLLAMVSVACAPITESVIREEPKGKVEFSVEDRYQNVFDTILAQSKTCFLKQPTQAQLTVTGTRINRDKTASITVAHVYEMAERDVYLLTDITAMGDQNTLVKTYYKSLGSEKRAKAVKNWVLNNEKGCELEREPRSKASPKDNIQVSPSIEPL